jgi:SAM-dependent methyltransferase
MVNSRVLGMTAFKKSYAEYYDLIYSDKDYRGESEYLDKILKKYSLRKVQTILDAGCGTGGHAFQLSKMGYDVTGIDASKGMIKTAKKKARETGTPAIFEVADLRDFKLRKIFDTCVSMFSVINYITTYDDLRKAFSCIRRHLKKGGMFIFDFWYGPAVLTVRPLPTKKMVSRGDIRIIRFAEPSLHTLSHTCEVEFDLLVLRRKNLLYSGKEKHLLRYYFPKEIEFLLNTANFKLLSLHPFLDLGSNVDDRDWDVTAVARAV